MPTEVRNQYPAARFHFEPVKDHHLPMLRKWLSRPHVQDWWEDVETEMGYLRDMLAGRDSTRPFVFSFDGETCGYIQYWHVGDVQTSEWIAREPWLADVQADAIGIDVTIADEANLSRGIGSSVVRIFAGKLAREGFDTIIIDPDPENTRAVRAYMKAGFVPIKEYEKSQGGVLLMEFKTNMSGTVS